VRGYFLDYTNCENPLARDEAGNARAVSSVDGELLSIGHRDKAFSIASVSPKFLHVLEIYDCGAMHPQENLGIQLCLEIAEGSVFDGLSQVTISQPKPAVRTCSKCAD